MPQNKITPAIEAGAELPELTGQQMKFVEGILAGKTASDAYRAAYDCSGSGDKTIWVEASRLRNNPDISLWLSAARKANLGASTVTLEGHLRELERIRELALESGNIGAAVQAEQCRGKAVGHYVEKFQEVSDHDPERTLRELERHSPELAASLAKAHNIPWTAIDVERVGTRH